MLRQNGWQKMRFFFPHQKNFCYIKGQYDIKMIKLKVSSTFHRHVLHKVRKPRQMWHWFWVYHVSGRSGTKADFPRHSRSVSIKFIWMLISSISISHNCLFFFLKQTVCPIRISVGKLERSGFESSQVMCISNSFFALKKKKHVAPQKD